MTDTARRLALALPDRYAVQRELGRGATSIVFLARDHQHGRDVAVKVLRPEMAERLGFDRFLREIDIASRLHHPHILPLFDSGTSEGVVYYVMPFVEGESLRDRLNRERQLPIAEALGIAGDIAEALSYAHANGIVHRDIKPENILLEGNTAIVADFGIARAISVAAGERLTESGIIIGTPHYMSPEQSDPKGQVDGRTDIYSLGCVLFEMLVGEPPYTGPDIHAVLARHLAAPVPSMRVSRTTISIAVDQAVQRALAKVPADRFRVAEEFAEALQRTESGVAIATPSSRRLKVGLTSLVALTLVALAGFAIWSRPNDRVDEQLLMVLPFRHISDESALDGDNCESLLFEAFTRWSDVRVLDHMRVNNEIERRGRPVNLDQALTIARTLGAGKLVWGEVRPFGDSVLVRATVTSVARSSQTLAQRSVHIGRDLGNLNALFNALADSLLLGDNAGDSVALATLGVSSVGGAMGTRLTNAWRAYQAGHRALAAWNLPAAASSFRQAATLDPVYAEAAFWAAQVMEWAGDDPNDWRPYATSARQGATGLSTRDAILVDALLALGEEDYLLACELYRRQLERDSLDFTGWFGLGECQSGDERVLPDRGSTSGWRFRSSYHAATQAYIKALNIVPAAHRAYFELVSSRLSRVLFTSAHRYRVGYVQGVDTASFGSFPSLMGDTVGFIPHRLSDLTASRPGTIPATSAAAVDRHRNLLKGVTDSWLRAFPSSFTAWMVRAHVLEHLGLVSAPAGESALEAIEKSRRLAPESEQLGLSITQVRLFLKSGEFERTRILADSVLKARRGTSLDTVLQLVPLAALLGRPAAMVDLLQSVAVHLQFVTPQGQAFKLSRAAAEDAIRLSVYSVMESFPDSCRALEASLERYFSTWAGPIPRTEVRTGVLDFPAMFGYPMNGIRAVHRSEGTNWLIQLQWRLSIGDSAGVRSFLVQLRSLQPPGDVAIEAIHQEAYLLLAVGDTLAASSLLDRWLNGLSVLRSDLLDNYQSPAGLVFSMIRRTELGVRSGDRRIATQWGRSVLDLWQTADPPLHPRLERIRRLML
jgi:eukaryotic-like serine/threonine-protein kinase